MNIIKSKNINRLRIKLANRIEWLVTPYIHRDHPNLLGRVDTLKKLAGGNISLSRFGDGEFMLALMERGILFQKKNRELSALLKAILLQHDNRVLVCINNEFMRNDHIFWILQYERSSKDYSSHESLKEPNDIGILSRKKEWIFYNSCYKILFGIKTPSLFGDATLFMLGLYHDEYRDDNIEMVMELYHSLFRNKRLLIVAPTTPLIKPSFRLLEQQLIANGSININYIDIPQIDAFSHYREIKSKILNFSHFDIVWIQAGPTASVLTYDLAINHNILAYDIGSFNVSLNYIL